MRCLFCGKSPAEGVAVFRVNAKGQPGVWACEKHIKQTDATVDSAVKQITDAFK
jgi:hypothetical protein